MEDKEGTALFSRGGVIPTAPVLPHMGEQIGHLLRQGGGAGTKLALGPFTQDQDTASLPPSIPCRPLPRPRSPRRIPPVMGTLPRALGPPGPSPAPVTPGPTCSRLHLRWCRCPCPGVAVPVPDPVPVSPFRYQCPVAGIAVPVSRAGVSVPGQVPRWPCRCPRAGADVPVSRSLCPRCRSRPARGGPTRTRARPHVPPAGPRPTPLPLAAAPGKAPPLLSRWLIAAARR